MRIAIIYSSISGNTKELACLLHDIFIKKIPNTLLFSIDEFSVQSIDDYDAVAVGTYTWGDGQIPDEMEPIYREFEKINRKKLVTGVFGTGDSFYPRYCGAVDLFRDLLKTKTNLSVTLKIELLPQQQDQSRCIKFVELFLERMNYHFPAAKLYSH